MSRDFKITLVWKLLVVRGFDHATMEETALERERKKRLGREGTFVTSTGGFRVQRASQMISLVFQFQRQWSDVKTFYWSSKVSKKFSPM